LVSIRKYHIQDNQSSRYQMMKYYLVSFLDYEYGEELFKENARKSPLDIKIASYLDVKVPFTKLKRKKMMD